MVDAQRNGADYWDYQQWFGALIGQLTGQPAYCTYAIAQTDAFVASEETKIASGAQPRVSMDSYLEVGPIIGDLMLTYDWCHATVTATQRTRWLAYAAQSVWNVWHPSEAKFGSTPRPWSGWSINNPSNNYYYSFLTATMLFGLGAHGEHAEAQQYLAFFRDTKIKGQLVPTFAADLAGGGSREGTGYGTAMKNLWRIYDWWKGSTGEDLSVLTPHAKQSMRHMLHSIVPTRDKLAPIGDQARDSTAKLFDYHREYLTALATLAPSDPLVPRVRGFVASSSVPQMSQAFQFVWDFVYAPPTAATQAMNGAGTAYYGKGTGTLFARSGWDTHATWLNLIAGPYTESHAHRDQSSFMLYKDEWLATDAVIFSKSGIEQGEELHNLVRIVSGGTTVRQKTNTTSQVVAIKRGPGWLHAAVDVTAAYTGQSAVQKVQREIVFLEPDAVVMFDRVTSSNGTQQVWMLSSPKQPTVSSTRSTFAGTSHTLRVERVIPAAASTQVVNLAASDSEFTGGFRLEETVAGGANQFLHVMWLDGAVGTVSRSDAGGRIGVTVTMANGKTATVRFGATGVDGTLEITGAGVQALTPGVSALPE